MKIWKIAALVALAAIPVILIANRKSAPLVPEYQDVEDPFEIELHAA